MPTAWACATTTLRSHGMPRTRRGRAMRPRWSRPAVPACSTASRPTETDRLPRFAGEAFSRLTGSGLDLHVRGPDDLFPLVDFILQELGGVGRRRADWHQRLLGHALAQAFVLDSLGNLALK